MKCLDRHLVTRVTTLNNTMHIQSLQVPEQRRLIRLCHQLLNRLDESQPRAVSLQASPFTATAFAASYLHTCMAHFTGKAVITEMRLPVGEETAAKPSVTDGDHHEVLHAMGTAIRFLTQSRNMGIIRHSHSQSQTVTQHGGQGDDAFPRQICRIFDTAGNRACTWSTDTNRTDSLITAVFFSKHHNLLTKGGHEFIFVLIVCGSEVILCQDIAPNVNQCVCSSFQTDINTYYTCLNLVNRFHSFGINISHINYLNKEYSLTSHAKTLAPSTS